MATATDEEKDTRHLSSVAGDAGDGADAKTETKAEAKAAAEAAEAEGKERTVEEMAEDPEEERVAPSQLAIPGTREKITGAFGGKLPTDSELRIMGGKRPIIGQFEKGETVTVISTGTIRAVEGSDTDDDWGTVSKTTRIHKMRQLHVRVATPEALVAELLRQVPADDAVILIRDAGA